MFSENLQSACHFCLEDQTQMHSIIVYGMMPASSDAIVGSIYLTKSVMSFKNKALF